MRRIYQRVDLQVSLLLAVFVAVAVMSCSLVAYYITYNDMKYALSERVMIIRDYLEKQLGKIEFTDFDEPEDITNEKYIELHDMFSAVKEATGVRYLYTAKRNGKGEFIYVIDGLDIHSEDYRYPGDLIEEEIYQDMERALGGEEVYPDEILHTSWGDIFICYLPLYDRGRIIGVLGIEFDANHQYEAFRMLKMFVPIAVITFTILAFFTSKMMFRRVNEIVKKEEKQRKDLAEALYREEIANKAKSSFLFNISHDIRTPMNAVVGFTQIALEHLDDKNRVEDSLWKVERASKHLKRLINDLLDMARIEKGKLELEIEPFHIQESIKETEQMFRTQMETKGITFDVKTENIKYECVLCDSLRMKQIAMNLLSNALKYTEPGGTVGYCVSQRDVDEDGYIELRLCIRDTGIGMTEEFQKHIFGIFEREKSATLSGVEGAGLGLAITRQLVELHNGTIQVESEKGKGTKFLIRMKLKIAEEQTEVQKETLSFEGKRVLLVEDNPLNREIAEVFLTEKGFEVECAEDGDVAVSMVSDSMPGYYDLVLMDIQMVRMDGYQATREIRKLSDPDLADIPIVALTANAMEEDKKHAFEAGMDGHIAKPIDMDKLDYTLMEIFKHMGAHTLRSAGFREEII